MILGNVEKRGKISPYARWKLKQFYLNDKRKGYHRGLEDLKCVGIRHVRTTEYELNKQTERYFRMFVTLTYGSKSQY